MRKTLQTSLLFAVLLASIMAWAGSPLPPPPVEILRAHAASLRFRSEEVASRRGLPQKPAEEAWPQPAQDLDMLHCDLRLAVSPSDRSISGTVTLTFMPLASLTKVKFLLERALTVIDVTLDGDSAPFKRKRKKIIVRANPPLQPGENHEVTIAYEGYPETTGGIGGGILFDSHRGTASATTLSEPFDSYAWWPCVDAVSDKFSSDVTLTVPADMVGASNGSLEGVTSNTDGTTSYHWTETYPLSNYLVSANVTNYATFSDTYTALDGQTTMPIEYYVYPEDLSSAVANFARVPEMIGAFASLVGEYPFLLEKYGMVEFPWGGGMEHQTLTSMGEAYVGGSGNYDGIYAHELAHQWWGDDVTCGTWHDIWLNEGFATYFEILWLAHAYDVSPNWVIAQYDDGLVNGSLKGTVYVKNAAKPFGDNGAIYDKGAWVLHMLRRVLGDALFFQALRDYRAAHEYANATTNDFQASCEAVYGHPLDWFFDQWVYTPKRPVYQVSFLQQGDTATVTIHQFQKHKIKRRATNRKVYIMPVDLTFHYEDGREETVTVLNDERIQVFTLPTSGTLSSVGLDEKGWILKAMK